MTVTAVFVRYVNRSAEDVAEVPLAVVTVTSTTPVPAGLVAVICVSVSLVIVAARLPKSTAVAPAKFTPVIVTDVPPARGPVAGLIPVTIVVAMTMFWVARPSVPVAGSVKTAALPAVS